MNEYCLKRYLKIIDAKLKNNMQKILDQNRIRKSIFKILRDLRKKWLTVSEREKEIKKLKKSNS